MESNVVRSENPASRSGLPHVPAAINTFNSIVKRLARLGVPLGPNALLTVRGRKSGEARTTPVAVVAIEGRRWVQSPYGNVNWARNLRAAGEATLTVGRREEPVRAIALSPEEAETFFRDVLGPYVGKSAFTRFIAGRLGLGEAIANPGAAATRYPVFELTPGVATRQ